MWNENNVYWRCVCMYESGYAPWYYLWLQVYCILLLTIEYLISLDTHPKTTFDYRCIVFYCYWLSTWYPWLFSRGATCTLHWSSGATELQDRCRKVVEMIDEVIRKNWTINLYLIYILNLGLQRRCFIMYNAIMFVL